MATRICLGNLSLRNNYFVCSKDCPPDPDPATPIVSNRRKAISYLDAIEMPLDTLAIYRQLNSLLSVEHLVLCVFEWAVTALRSGRHRVYLGVELLKLASLDGSDIQALMMDFLGRLDIHTKVNTHHVYLLVSELVRTDFFSIAIYMRWLIARGGLSKVCYLNEVGFFFAGTTGLYINHFFKKNISRPAHVMFACWLKSQCILFHLPFKLCETCETPYLAVALSTGVPRRDWSLPSKKCFQCAAYSVCPPPIRKWMAIQG